MDAHVAEWQKRAEAFKPLNLKQIEPALAELDAHLTLRSHIVGYGLTDADTTVWTTLRENRVAHAYIKQNLMANLCRWFRYIEEAYPQQTVVLLEQNKKAMFLEMWRGTNLRRTLLSIAVVCFHCANGMFRRVSMIIH